MKIVKNNVNSQDERLALDILNKLRAGDRLFGAPAESLKKTLSTMEENAPKKDSIDDLAYNLDDKEYQTELAKLKKGIKGEQDLSQYLEKVIRLDKELSDMIVFASLGDKPDNNGIIHDTDFLAVYGSNLLAIDAKAVNTNPEIPLFVQGGGIFTGTNHDFPLLEVNSQVPYWKKTILRDFNGTVNSIKGCVCIINKQGSSIFRDEEWLTSDIKPLHVSELVEFLHTWVKGKDPTVDLSLLCFLSKKQVKANESSLDLSKCKRIFGV